jgi:hypothetical protein
VTRTALSYCVVNPLDLDVLDFRSQVFHGVIWEIDVSLVNPLKLMKPLGHVSRFQLPDSTFQHIIWNILIFAIDVKLENTYLQQAIL